VEQVSFKQWRRQDLLRGGTKMEIMSRGITMDFRAGCSSCSITNSFVTNAVLIERVVTELLTSASANLADYKILR